MADWVTISSLATAGGTLALAIATYGAVRSSNRAAAVAELALQQQLRPVLVNSQLGDPLQKIMFREGKWLQAAGGEAAAEHTDGTVYLALSVRNVGTGIGVLIGWYVMAGEWPPRNEPAEAEEFRRQMRDLLIPAGGIGLWQGAVRDSSEELHGILAGVVAERRPFAIDLLYSDHMGHQRSISRFSISPVGDDRWLTGAARHWNLDQPAGG
jgi:hypothetical protein